MPAMAHVGSHPAVHPSSALYVRWVGVNEYWPNQGSTEKGLWPPLPAERPAGTVSGIHSLPATGLLPSYGATAMASARKSYKVSRLVAG
ncbi:hypothetical protein Ddc_16610 [Ditylenchus destructor]|nr:hypothetical protein Ddc_16610 [Ditylenchus destructor]